MENRFWGWVVVVGSQVQVCENCESGRVVGITANERSRHAQTLS